MYGTRYEAPKNNREKQTWVRVPFKKCKQCGDVGTTYKALSPAKSWVFYCWTCSNKT